MMKLKYLLIGLVGLSFFISCSEDEEEAKLILPSNFTFEVSLDTAYDGTTHFTASAQNVNYYSFYVNDNGKESAAENKTGIYSYQFTQNGTYSVRARAHATANEFVESLKTIDIVLGSTGGGTGGGSDTSDVGFSTPLTYPNYTLAWNDEFNSTSLNPLDWNFEIGTGNGGWGNNELQYYREENVSFSNGFLIIEAKNEFFNNNNYTSSRITTQGKKTFQYGRIDIRARMPQSQGLWPALWMLGNNISTVSWPACGEIDVMEMVGGTTTSNRGDGVVHGTAHWSDANGSRALFGNSKQLGTGEKLSDEFHVYSIVWDSLGITWYIDNQQYHSLDTRPSALSEFNQKFFFIFNVAVGGDWPGSPDNSTVLPQKMIVDYVRVFQ